VDQKSLLLKELIGTLSGPVLVVGGGPSAVAELERVPGVEKLPVFAPNGHATRIPGLDVRYIVSKDDHHSETKKPMRDLMGKFGLPVISPHWWGNYRMADWYLQSNSGFAAIAIAVACGAYPVITVGFDCYQNGTYFHDLEAKNASRGRRLYSFEKQMTALWAKLGANYARPVGGPLKKYFPRFVPGEHYAPLPEPAFVAAMRKMQSHRVRATMNFHWTRLNAEVPAGAEFAVSTQERDMLIRNNAAVVVDGSENP
jgi:hypothetical protein